MEWPRGEATACKAVYTGSNPVSTSARRTERAISSVGEHFLDTEGVTGSIPVSPTTTKRPLTSGNAKVRGVSIWLACQMYASWSLASA